MKVLICGGRDYPNDTEFFAAMDRFHAKHKVTLVIHGGATGADDLAGVWAEDKGIHCAVVKPLWDKFGRGAGPKRNRAMLRLEPSGVIAFPGGKGTADMVQAAKEAGLPVWEPGL